MDIPRRYTEREWSDEVFRSQENVPKAVSPHPPTGGDWRDRPENEEEE